MSDRQKYPLIADRYKGRPDTQAKVKACWRAWEALNKLEPTTQSTVEGDT